MNGGPDVGGLKSSGVSNALNGIGTGANQGDTQPAAYLNYILFDQNYKLMNAGWQVVPTGSFSRQHVTMPTVTAKEAGYIFVYLSYEDQSNNYVYFDDFRVTVTPTNVIQSNEYYAFGMQASNSWTRDNTANNFLANSGTELNPTTALYDLDYRNFDPVLGRMNGVDMMTDRFSSVSPYNFSFNNPVLMSDPSGAIPCTFCQDPGPENNPYYYLDGGSSYAGMQSINGSYSYPAWYSNAMQRMDMIDNARDGDPNAIRWFASNYGSVNGTLVFNERQNVDGSISKGITVYTDKSYWNDIGPSFASDGTALGFWAIPSENYDKWMAAGMDSGGVDFGSAPSWLTSPMGDVPVYSPFPKRNNGLSHPGTDYAVDPGTPVKVTAGGKVLRAENFFTLGNMVIVDHGLAVDGVAHVYTLYAHGSSFAVSPGVDVNVGDTIMYSGNTGASEGPHVHYEVIVTPFSAFSGNGQFFQNIDIRHSPSELGNYLGRR